MVDVLFATAFYLKNDQKQIERMRPYPPLGPLFAAANLRAHGYTVALYDAMLQDDEATFLDALDRHRPRIVACYEDQFHWLNKMCLLHARDATCRNARAAKQCGATVVAAGADPTDQPRVYLDAGVDYVLCGEGDHTLLELLDHLTGRDGAPTVIDDVRGLALKNHGPEGGVRWTERRHPERHIDRFPQPAWDLVDPEPYRQAWTKAHGFFSLNMITTRGCPFHCNWCAKPIWGQHYAVRAPSRVASEMARLKTEFRAEHIWFADDIFGINPEWVVAFADEVTRRDACLPFMMQSRIDLMTERAITALARAGCNEVWLGVESGSQKIIDAMDKGTSCADIGPVRAHLADAGIRACFFLQFGFPGETADDLRRTVEMVRTHKPDDIGVSVTYPLPGTKLYDLVRRDLAAKDHWTDSAELAVMYQGPYKSPFYRELRELLHREVNLNGRSDPETRAAAAELDADWAAWWAREPEMKSARPTTLDGA